MRSYSKVIIDLKGQRSIDLVSRTASLSGAFSLAGAVREFIENTSAAKQALQSAHTAGMCNISLTRALYKYLQKEDFDPELLVGCGYTKRLVNPCIQIQDQIKERGLRAVTDDMQHGIVRVRDMVIDLTHLRLGDTYQKVYNYPFREFKEYWIQIKSMSQVADFKPTDIAARVKNMNNISRFSAEEKRGLHMA